MPHSHDSHTMAVLHSCNVFLQTDSTRGAGGAMAGIPAKFGSFYAQSLLSARCKPCLAANLADLWWNSRTSSTIHFPTGLQGSDPSFSNLLKSKFIHKWEERGAGAGGEWQKYAKPLLVWTPVQLPEALLVTLPIFHLFTS